MHLREVQTDSSVETRMGCAWSLSSSIVDMDAESVAFLHLFSIVEPDASKVGAHPNGRLGVPSLTEMGSMDHSECLYGEEASTIGVTGRR